MQKISFHFLVENCQHFWYQLETELSNK